MHANLKQLSHSSRTVLHRCAAKYKMEKLSPHQESWGNPDLDFGKVVGIGVQELLIHGDINRAWMKMFEEWQTTPFDDEEDRNKKKKNFWHALHAVERFIPHMHQEFVGYELAILNDRPAIELGFSIDCGEGFTYRGYFDAVMIHKMQRRLAVLENKTTGAWSANEASYKNSGQGLGYDLVLGAIAKQLGLEHSVNFPVFYPVYEARNFEWKIFEFMKSRAARAKWITDIVLDKELVKLYDSFNRFPMHGESCMDFNRQCPFFGMCDLSDAVLQLDKAEERIEPPAKYDFYFTLSEIIENQIEMLEG